MFRVGKCRISAEPSGFYSTVYFTVQCGVEWYLIYTIQCNVQCKHEHPIQYSGHYTIQCAMQYIVQCTRLWFYSTMYLTVQCGVELYLIYNTVQCAMQTRASHTTYLCQVLMVRTGVETDEVCLFHCARDSRQTTFASGKMRGSRERVGSSSDGAHGSRDRRGMSVPLRAELETDDICKWQSAWESRTSGVQFWWCARDSRKTGYVCPTAHRS